MDGSELQDGALLPSMLPYGALGLLQCTKIGILIALLMPLSTTVQVMHHVEIPVQFQQQKQRLIQ